MSLTSSLLSRVLQGGSCTREELIALSREPLEELCQAANAIREHPVRPLLHRGGGIPPLK